MSMTDPIADFLTRVRNALLARHARVDVPASRMKEQLARILLEQGYIEGWETVSENEKGTVRITLKYDPTGIPVIKGLERVSKPGRRVYFKAKALPKVLNGLGTAIVSTSHGIMTETAARGRNVGGEVLCNVW